MADKSITVVNFEQLELLLQNCVVRSAANGTGKFASGSQLFIEVTGRTSGNNGVLHLKNGLNNDEYTSPDLTGGFTNAAKFLGETILNHGNINGKRNLITTSTDTTFEKPVAIKDGSTNIANFATSGITLYLATTFNQLATFNQSATFDQEATFKTGFKVALSVSADPSITASTNKVEIRQPLEVYNAGVKIFETSAEDGGKIKFHRPTDFNGLFYAGGHEIRAGSDNNGSYIDFTQNEEEAGNRPVIMKLHRDYVDFNKTATFKNTINIDGLIYAGGHEIRAGGDNDGSYINFTQNEEVPSGEPEAKRIIMKLHRDNIEFYRTATFKNALNIDGLIWAGGRYIRFPQKLHLECQVTESNRYDVIELDQNWVNFYKPVTIVGSEFKVVAKSGNNEKILMQAFGGDYNTPTVLASVPLYQKEGSSNYPVALRGFSNPIDLGVFNTSGEITNISKDTFTTGLYMFTYSNTQAFFYMDTANLTTSKILRTAIPVIYDSNGSTVPGMLKITTNSSNKITIKISDGNHNAYQNLHLYAVLTKLA